ncbi:MAG: SurA N-terminal domain-containing protein [Bacteroidales bacterium]|nr:SurA N-terminal domain-containing protein [Bacteroidales bacterium]
MAVLQTIRVKFGVVISIIIALALLSFIIDTNTLESALSSMSAKYDVGKIAGKSVSYTDFQADVERFNTISEIMTGTSVKNEQQQEQIRNTAWQSLIDKYLFVKNAKAAGINVGEAEMVALTTGDMVSPIISQNMMFQGENGYDPNNLVDFVKGIDSDESGRLQMVWNYLQNTGYTQEFYAKYASLFTQSDIQNPLMLEKTIAENNNTTNVEFVMVPFGFATDSTVVVSNSEIQKFYNDHKNFFKQPASRDMEYVVFEVVPSAEDIAAVSESFSDLYDEFATTDNVKNFLLKNSDRPYSEYWYKQDELKTVSEAISEFVNASEPGQVSSVITEGNTFYGARVMAKSSRPESIEVKIMQAADDATEESLKAQLEETSSMQMTQTYIIPGCEVLFTAPVGTPLFIEKTQYGRLFAEVVSKSEPVEMKQVAIFQKETTPSKETYNTFYAKANNFAVLAAGGYDNYKAAVDTMGVYSHPMNKILESTSSYGAIENAKEVTRWVFDNKAGKVSNIITVNNNYFFIATVKKINKEGITPVKEVAPMIQNRLYAEKAAEKKAAEVKEKIAGMNDLQAIAEALNTTVSTQNDVAFASMMSQGLDPKFIGALSVSPENKICGPVAGSIGVYVYKVLGHDTASFYTEDDAKNFAAQKNQYTTQMILPVMMESADVKDNRARFY